MIAPGGADFFAVVGTPSFLTLESAVVQWNEFVALAPASTGVIVLPNFESYAVDLTGDAAVRLPAGCNLLLASGHPVATEESKEIIWSRSCVTLRGNIEVKVAARASLTAGETAPAGQLQISGLWIAGQLSVTGEAASILISDTTLVPGLELTRSGEPVSPGDPSIRVTASGASVALIRSICGPIAADAGGSTRICSSVVDATSPCCVAYAASDLSSAGADLHVEDCTFVGRVRTRTFSLASNTIFFARRLRHDPWPAAIWASRRQTGCIRFCSLPYDSITPRRYQCLPPDEGTEAALAPRFISLRYGTPDYALLSGDVPMAAWRGADNGSQMGVYYQIQESEAVRNIQLRTPEYLPVGLESGIFLHPSHATRVRRPPSIVYGSSKPPRCGCEDEDDVMQVFSGIGGSLM
jgi:hypothetical protein